MDTSDLEDSIDGYIATWLEDEPASSDLRGWGFVTDLEDIISKAEDHAEELPPKRKPTSQRIQKAVEILLGLKKGGSAEDVYREMVKEKDIESALIEILKNI